MKIVTTILALALALPTIGLAGDGRYQMVIREDGQLVFLDTNEGQWKICNHTTEVSQDLYTWNDYVKCGVWHYVTGTSTGQSR